MNELSRHNRITETRYNSPPSYTGLFTRANEQVKRLLNLNVDFLEETQDEELRRVIQITTVVSDSMNQPGYAAVPKSNTAEEACTLVANRFKDMHRQSKDILAAVIDDHMCRRIALKE